MRDAPELQELVSKLERNDEHQGWTTQELTEAWDCGYRRAMRLISQGIDAGYIKVIREKRPNRVGILTTVRCYYFPPKRKQAAKRKKRT